MSKNLLTDGRSGEPFTGPIKKFLAHWLEISQTPRETKHLFLAWGKYYEDFHWICFDRWRVNRRKNVLITDIENLGKLVSSEISRKTERERSLDNRKRWRICISHWRWLSKNIREETTNSKKRLWDGNPPEGERISAENLMATGQSFNKKKQMTKESKRIFVFTQKFGNTYGHQIEPWNSIYVPRQESSPFPLSPCWCHQVNFCISGDSQEKMNFKINGISTRTEIYQIRGQVFTIFTFWERISSDKK